MAARYVLSLIAAALAGGILTGLLPGGSCGRALKLLCGVFLLAAVLRPVGKLELPDVGAWLENLDREAEAAARAGEDSIEAQRRQVISDRLEAYILDKAAGLGLEAAVELTLDENGLPDSAALTGTWTQTQREQMERILEEDLGVPKERQRWQSN